MSLATPSAMSNNHPSIPVASGRVGSASSSTGSGDEMGRSAMNDNSNDSSDGEEDTLNDEEDDEEDNDEDSSNNDGNSEIENNTGAPNASGQGSAISGVFPIFGEISEAVEARRVAEVARAVADLEAANSEVIDLKAVATEFRQNCQRNEQEQLERLNPYLGSLSDQQVEALIAVICNRILPNHNAQHSIANCFNDEYPSHLVLASSNGHASTSITSHNLDDQPIEKKRRDLLQALIRSQGFKWEECVVDRSELDSLVPHHNDTEEIQPAPVETVPLDQQQSSSMNPQSGDSISAQLSRTRPARNRRNITVCRRFCSTRGRIRNSDSGMEMETFRSDGQSAEGDSDDHMNKDAPCHERFFTLNNKNIVYGGLTIIIILVMAILGAVCFYLFSPTASTNQPEPAAKFTKIILKSLLLNASNARTQLTYDQFSDYILLTKQHDSNRSHIETTFLDGEFLHHQAVIGRLMNTNESCKQISLEIVCCDTFCEGQLKEGLIVTRHFPVYSTFCGAWRHEFNSAYICTKKKDQITITEFWSKRFYRFSSPLTHPSVNIADFHAIDYIPNHIAVIVTDSSSKLDKFCLGHLGRKLIKEMKCHHIGFLQLEPMHEGITRQIAYLEHLTWAILSSKVVSNSLEWTIAVFKQKQLIFKDSDTLFSKDNQLIVFGESQDVQVCAIELDLNEEKVVSCAVYKFEI